jgi:hypothetical protein
MRVAAKTWGGDFYKKGGGGAVWDGFAYDAEANLVYVGTGNAEPWVQKFRGAQNVDNLYTCSILAVDLTTVQHRHQVPREVFPRVRGRDYFEIGLRLRVSVPDLMWCVGRNDYPGQRSYEELVRPDLNRQLAGEYDVVVFYWKSEKIRPVSARWHARVNKEGIIRAVGRSTQDLADSRFA